MKLRSVFLFIVVIALGALLLQTSQYVQEQQAELERLEKEIAHEEEALRVLEAEWTYLSSPARLERLAKEYLGMDAPNAAQLISTGDALPHSEGESEGEMTSQPVSLRNRAENMSVRPAQKPIRRDSQARSRSFNDILREATQ